MAAAEPRAILADCLFDGREFIHAPHTVELDGDAIAAVRPGIHASGPHVLDARGKTLLPGLINSHVHIARGGMFEAPSRTSAAPRR